MLSVQVPCRKLEDGQFKVFILLIGCCPWNTSGAEFLRLVCYPGPPGFTFWIVISCTLHLCYCLPAAPGAPLHLRWVWSLGGWAQMTFPVVCLCVRVLLRNGVSVWFPPASPTVKHRDRVCWCPASAEARDFWVNMVWEVSNCDYVWTGDALLNCACLCCVKSAQKSFNSCV